MGCDYAAQRGVRQGMTVAQATALLDRAVLVYPQQAEQDGVALLALARWCLRFTPRVMATHHGSNLAGATPRARAGARAGVGAGVGAGAYGLVLDMTGCDRLYGGTHLMVEAVVDGLRRLRLTVRAALAPTRAGAWALAQSDRSAVCLVQTRDELQLRLDGLGVEALGLEPAEIDGLGEVGIDRVQQLRDLPREEIVARLGRGVLRRLDLARGEAACEDIDPVKRWEPPEVELRFAGPTTQYEAIQEAARRLCERLAERLRDRMRSAGSLTLEVQRLDESWRTRVARKTITLSRPSRDASHLWMMLRPHVERLHLGHGVEALTLTAQRAPRVGQAQMGRSSERVEDAQLRALEAQLIDVLAAKLGSQHVLRPVAVPTHIPEASLRWVPAVERAGDPPPDRLGEGAWSDAPWENAPERPSAFLNPPEPADVVLMNPEGPVITLTWRGHSRPLTHSIGPERIAPRWWKSPARRVVLSKNATPPERETPEPANESHAEPGVNDPPAPPLWSDLAARDYYRVQDEAGLWLWVFRRLDTGRWFVHGLWL